MVEKEDKEIVVKPEGMPFEEAKKYEMMAITKYCEKHGGNVTPQAVSYCINKGQLDFVWLGKERMVVMTPKTLEYKPNPHPNRKGELGADTERV